MSLYKRGFEVCSLILAVSMPLLGTTIIAVRGPDGVIHIGADSKIVLSEGEPTFECKISVTNGVVFAHSGLFASAPEAGFDFEKITASSFSGNESFSDQLNFFAVSIRNGLARAGVYARAAKPDFYKANFLERNVADAILVDTRPGEFPVFVSEVFSARESGTELKVRSSGIRCPPDCGESGVVVCILGVKTAALNLVSDPLLLRDVPARIKAAIQAQGKARPEAVGGLISVLEIHPRTGLRWLEKGVCK